MLSDIEIAQSVEIEPIAKIAGSIGITDAEVEPYGHHMAKISYDLLDRTAGEPKGKYIVVTAVTPTPLGEGKTLTTVGLGQALGRLGHKAMTTIRQPSMGPVFGIKGGAAGGGYSQVIPMVDLNLHLTGDFHAITAAHNLCAAFLDNHIFHGNELDIDPDTVSWGRALDISDRSLREVEVGLGGEKNGIPHRSTWIITSASEIMALLSLAEDLGDLRERVGRIIVARNRAGEPVTAEDLKVAGSMTVILKDAIKPTLLQNLEGGPVMVHTGPFANIAPGNSSITADRMGLATCDYVITESGFGADMGCEKFMNLKCRVSGLEPDAVVMVATVRAIKTHSGCCIVKAGKPLPETLVTEDLESLRLGMANLTRHIDNLKSFGIPVVVAINAFPTDTQAEHDMIREAAFEAGAVACEVHTMHADGGAGGEELAQAVIDACEMPHTFSQTYEDSDTVAEKIEKVATRIFRADGVDYEPAALESLERIAKFGFDHLPICMAKTQYSISDDASLKGAPEGWRLTVRDVRISAGAGFAYVLCGKILTMPGLPSQPAGNNIDIDADGTIVGLF